MNSSLEQALDRALAWSPAQSLSRWWNSAHLVVLAYHGVDNAHSFERQIEFVSRTMHPVTLESALRGISGGARLPPRAVLVTFDDADVSLYEVGMPILQRHRVPAVAFVVAGLVGTSRAFWWNEVAELVTRGARASSLDCHDVRGCIRALKNLPNERRLQAIEELRQRAGGLPLEARQLTGAALKRMGESGVAIGNHTLTHPCLDRCDDRTLEHEIAGAHDRLTELVGAAPRVFAYPNGNADGRAMPALARLGYEAAFLFNHQISPVPPTDRWLTSRVRVNSTDSLDRFRLIVSGLHTRIHAATGRR